MVRQTAGPDVLVTQYWPGHDGVHLASASRHLPGLGQHYQGHVVCAFTGSHSFAADGDPGVDADTGRSGLRYRHSVPDLVRVAFAHRTQTQTADTGACGRGKKSLSEQP